MPDEPTETTRQASRGEPDAAPGDVSLPAPGAPAARHERAGVLDRSGSRRAASLLRGLADERTLVKMAFGAGFAWWLGNLAGQPRPVFAAIVPILVIRSDTTATMRGSLGRVIGVLLGVGLGLVALEIHPPSPVMAGTTIAVALLIDRVVRALPRLELDTRNQTAVSALLMLFVATSVTAYALARLTETAIGGGVALLVDGLDERLSGLLSRGRHPAGALHGGPPAAGEPPARPDDAAAGHATRDPR